MARKSTPTSSSSKPRSQPRVKSSSSRAPPSKPSSSQTKSAPPVHPDSDDQDSEEDSDSEVPETVSRSQSLRQAKDERRAVEEWRAEEKAKKKAKVEKAKAKAEAEESSRTKSKKTSSASADVDAAGDERILKRMQQAMMDAGDEDDDEDEDEDMEGFAFGDGDDDDDDLSSGSEDDEDDDYMRASDDEDADEDLQQSEGLDEDDSQDEDEDEWTGLSSQPESKKSILPPSASDFYLPDHIFESGFAAQHRAKAQTRTESKLTSKKKGKSRAQESKVLYSASSRMPMHRKTVKKTAKDVTIGSNTFRLSNTSNTTSKPNLKAIKFYEKTLGLRGGAVRGRGWERRAANVGVLKSAGGQLGPARGFVRPGV